MPYAKRRRWIESATKTDTLRRAASVIGVTHPTLSRWIKSGIPVGTLTGLVIEFNCDPIEALVVWGYLKEEDIPRLNFAALVKYVPGEVLSGEIHERYVDYMSTRPDPYQKKTVGMLRRA
jgi:hypothetical protein